MYSVDPDVLNQTFIAPAQMAREENIPPQTLNWHLNNSKLPFVRIGGHRMFYRQDWQRYLAEQRAKGNLARKESANGHS